MWRLNIAAILTIAMAFFAWRIAVDVSRAKPLPPQQQPPPAMQSTFGQRNLSFSNGIGESGSERESIADIEAALQALLETQHLTTEVFVAPTTQPSQ